MSSTATQRERPPASGPAAAIARAAARPGSGTATARDRILSEAVVRFYGDGIRAVGIDLLIARSGTAKATFYRHFPSKADLVVAYVDRRSLGFLEWLGSEVARRADGREPALLVVFDALADLFTDDAFRGCAVINAVAEVGGEVPGVVARARQHAQALRRVLVGLDDGPRVPSPSILDAWLLLIHGAFVDAQRERDRGPADRARAAGRALLSSDVSH